jgi:uncharacterized protein YuzE
MRVQFDEKADAIYLRLDESEVIESEEVHPGIILDFNKKDEVVGVEVLRVKNRIPLASLKQMKFDVA